MAEVLSIDELRERIDVIDNQLVRLLNVRVACAVEIGKLKHELGMPVGLHPFLSPDMPGACRALGFAELRAPNVSYAPKDASPADNANAARTMRN